MALDDLDAEITYLMNVLQGEPDDLREIEFRLKQAISALRAEGLPVPEDLKRLEAEIERRLT